MKLSGRVWRYLVRALLSFMVVPLFVLHLAGVVDLGVVEPLENYLYDLRLRLTMPNGQDSRIVIVDIDEKSLQGIGHWPWSRNTLAQLVDRLFDHYQIDVLGFDVVFAERDTSSGLPVLEQMAQGDLRDDPHFQGALARKRLVLDYDRIFADSLKNRRVVLGYYFRHDGDDTGVKGALPAAVLPNGSFDPTQVGSVLASGYTGNLPELQRSAMAGGFFNASPLVDPDGVFRRISLLQAYQGALYETLGLAVARLVLRENSIGLEYDAPQPDLYALENVALGQRRVPVDIDLGTLISYRGKQGSFPYVSAVDVLNGTVPRESLQGAIVLVGATAPGLMDLRATPAQDLYAGVEAHANVVAGILDGNIKARPAYLVGLEPVALIVLGLLLALVLPLLSPLWASLFSLSVLSSLVAFNLYQWTEANLVLPLASLLLMVLLIFVLNLAYGFFVEARGRRQLAGRFGQYVPPELVREMALDPSTYTLVSENRELTVLFSDIRGFTSISEGMAPQALSDLMNAYLTAMTGIIQRHRGTIDKYMGDAIMAFWGAPMADAKHTKHALLAALEMVDRLDALQTEFRARGWPEIKAGVGINTGIMTVGNMGSEFRMAYTVMGDAVNLGSRLEGITKQYGVQIVVSDFTRAQLLEFAFRELDVVRVKGKDEPVAIFEPLGLAEELDAEIKNELTAYHAALAAYRARDWSGAEERFRSLATSMPERHIYAVYLERIEHFRAVPPPNDWDGVFVLTTK